MFLGTTACPPLDSPGFIDAAVNIVFVFPSNVYQIDNPLIKLPVSFETVKTRSTTLLSPASCSRSIVIV